MASVANGVVGGTVHVPNGTITAVTQNLATTGTVDAQTMYLTVDATAGSFTATLPSLATFLGVGGQAAIAGSTRLLYIKRTDAVVANTVTLDGSGAETINGAATAALGASNGLILAATSAGWRSVASNDVTASGSINLPDDVPLNIGTAPKSQLEYDSALGRVQIQGVAGVDAATAVLWLETGASSSLTGARVTGGVAIQSGVSTATGSNGGDSGNLIFGSGQALVTTAHTGGDSGSVAIGSGLTNSSNAGGTGGDTGAVSLASGSALSTLGVSGNSGSVSVTTGNSADATTGSISITTGNGATSGGIAITTGTGSTARGAITAADTNGSYRMADQNQRVRVTIPGGNGAGNVGDLNSAPVLVIPAPGAGKYIEFVSHHAFLDFAGVAYDTVATTNYRYVGTAIAFLATAIPSASLMTAAADAHSVAHGSVANFVPTENTGVEIFTSADPFGAAGNSPLIVEVIYRIRSFTLAS